MSSAPRYDRVATDHTGDGPVDDDIGIMPDDLDAAYHGAPHDDDVLPYSAHFNAMTAPKRWKLAACIITCGTFLATCPLARISTGGYPVRQLLIVLLAFCATIPAPPRGGRTLSYPKRTQRILIACAGFCISTYACFGLADDVHFETQWRSLLWYRTPDGFAFGYLVRIALVVAGFFVQRAARVQSTLRILGTYFLCALWLYADVPLTLVELSRGRERW